MHWPTSGVAAWRARLFASVAPSLEGPCRLSLATGRKQKVDIKGEAALQARASTDTRPNFPFVVVTTSLVSTNTLAY